MTDDVRQSDMCPRCGTWFDMREDKIVTCPICGEDCCTRECVAGVGCACFRCEDDARP